MDSLTTNENNFNSKNLGMRAQKKILGKMSSRNFAKHFIDDKTGKVLDDVYKILKDHYNKKEAEKVMKCLIKMTIKIGVLHRNDQFSPEELKQLTAFQRKFHALIMTVISFCQVDFSYDRNFLKNLLGETQACLTQLIRSHLSDKSVQRTQLVFNYFGKEDFMDAVFKSNSKYVELRNTIVSNLGTLLDEGHV